jgi:hypothetical protein
MTDTERQIIAAARSFVNNCRCGKAYKSRGMTDPSCAACEFEDYLTDDAVRILKPTPEAP